MVNESERERVKEPVITRIMVAHLLLLSHLRQLLNLSNVIWKVDQSGVSVIIIFCDSVLQLKIIVCLLVLFKKIYKDSCFSLDKFSFIVE